jgi:hypothetical protein
MELVVKGIVTMRKLFLLLLLFGLMSVTPDVVAQDGGPIAVGQVVAGEITSEKPRDVYTFDGVAGETLVITMDAAQQGLDSYIELTGPNGEYFFNDDRDGTLNSLLPIILPTTGTYTLLATRCCGENQGQSIGPYELFIEQIEVTPVVAGEPVTIVVNDSQPYVYLSFTGETDRVLSLYGERLAGDATFDIAVRGPSGQTINNASQTEDGTVSLDPMFVNVDGSYIMVVSRGLVFPGAVPSGGSVSLRLTLQEVETQRIAIGDTISGTLDDENPVDHYLFSGTPDDLLRLAGSQAEGSQTYEILIYTQQGSVFYGVSTLILRGPAALSSTHFSLPRRVSICCLCIVWI